jgi:hypothetical protein
MTWDKITDEHDPDRCEGVTGQGQCLFKRIGVSKFCPRHGGNNANQVSHGEKVRNYHLTRYRARVNQFADNPEVKSLREEIGILRLMLETVLEKCQDENDLLMFSNQIQELVMKINKVVESCHKLEQSTGVLLDKQTILVLCDGLVKVIADHVEDGDALDQISVKMAELVASMGGIKNVADVAANG